MSTLCNRTERCFLTPLLALFGIIRSRHCVFMSKLSVGLLFEGIAHGLHRFLMSSHCVSTSAWFFLAKSEHLSRNTETLLMIVRSVF